MSSSQENDLTTTDDLAQTLDIVQQSIGDTTNKKGYDTNKINDVTTDHENDEDNEDSGVQSAVEETTQDEDDLLNESEKPTDNSDQTEKDVANDEEDIGENLENDDRGESIEIEENLGENIEGNIDNDGHDAEIEDANTEIESITEVEDDAHEDDNRIQRVNDTLVVIPENVIYDDNDDDLIELSACGTVDDLDRGFVDQMSSTFKDNEIVLDCDDIDDEIELSSDEENEENQDVSVLVLKRPPLVADATIDILDSDEEYPVCLVEGEKNKNVNIEEKRGYIKEFIEMEGLGTIYSESFGLVLFHLSHVWINGEQLSLSRTRDMLELGTWVSFYDQTLTGLEFKKLSSEEVCHQALVVWTGDRPQHLMKTIDNLGDDYMRGLNKSRDNFMLYLNGEVFLPLSLVRTRGVVIGYISDNIGIIETYNTNDRYEDKVNAFFHSDDVWIFKKPLRRFEQMYKTSAGRLLPVGLSVSVDARRLNMLGVNNLEYQAVNVFAGSWPNTPAPTLLPGGRGSFTQAYEVPDNHTFYYLELSLEAKLSAKVDMLKHELRRSHGRVEFIWRNVNTIRHEEDKLHWRSQFTARPRPNRNQRGQRPDFRQVKHLFKAPPIRHFKTKSEMDDSSSIATLGDSSRSNMSDVSSTMSRPWSRASNASSQMSSKSRRDWYNPNNWQHGGLRIKNEIKTELDDSASVKTPSLKRIKLES